MDPYAEGVARGDRKGLRSVFDGGRGAETGSLGLGGDEDAVQSGELAVRVPRGVLGSTAARRALRFSAGLTWLFEGPGYLYVALTVDAASLAATAPGRAPTVSGSPPGNARRAPTRSLNCPADRLLPYQPSPIRAARRSAARLWPPTSTGR